MDEKMIVRTNRPAKRLLLPSHARRKEEITVLETSESVDQATG
jgi:hypothetical protein